MSETQIVLDAGVTIIAGYGFEPVSQPSSQSGSGTLTDPTVVWICRVIVNSDYAKKMVQACEMIARQEAIERGFKCVVIRHGCHSTTNARDFTGETFSLCQAEGHVYVEVGADGIPVSKISPEFRKVTSIFWVHSDAKYQLTKFLGSDSWRQNAGGKQGSQHTESGPTRSGWQGRTTGLAGKTKKNFQGSWRKEF